MTAVREIMTSDPACVDTDQTLQSAADMMARLGVGSLPIRGDDGSLKGMLTDRDIVVRGIAAGKDLATPAGELGQGGTVSVGPDDSADDLLATMVEYQVRRLPVVDRERIVGMVSLTDAARVLPEPDIGDLTEALSVGEAERRGAAR